MADTLGKYRLLPQLGHGGMADVYLALAPGPEGEDASVVVIKKLRPSLASYPDFIAMFLDEAKLAARLHHPNVVRTYEVGECNGEHYLAMEFLDGQPLNRVLHVSTTNGRPFPLRMMLRVLADALAGLHYAHELRDHDGSPLNVVHRDVSPPNIFVTYEGHTKIVDFGIAKAMTSTTQTSAGTVKGKMRYMAPEQARGDRVDRRADIYAVGVLLWEALSGRRFWRGIGDAKILQRLVIGFEVESPRAHAPDVPAALEAVCLKALAYDPAKRFRTADELRAALDSFLAAEPQPISTADVATFVCETFASERAKMRESIGQWRAGAPTLLDSAEANAADADPRPAAPVAGALLPVPPRRLVAPDGTTVTALLPARVRAHRHRVLALLVAGAALGIGAVMALVLLHGQSSSATAPPKRGAAGAASGGVTTSEHDDGQRSKD